MAQAMDMFCCDHLASHQRKCDCALAGMATWRFSSHQKVMKSLLGGTGYKPPQNVNYHGCRAHGYERSGHMISGFWDGMDWLCLDGTSQWLTVIG
jgi:hypothetical protein